MTVPGVGPLTATALIAAVGNAQQFRNGRQSQASSYRDIQSTRSAWASSIG
jgi:transposase